MQAVHVQGGRLSQPVDQLEPQAAAGLQVQRRAGQPAVVAQGGGLPPGHLDPPRGGHELDLQHAVGAAQRRGLGRGSRRERGER
jgi:hypothetical protein